MKPPTRVVLVSPYGPYRLHLTRSGMKCERKVSGLVTSLLPLMDHLGGVWLAWGEPVGRYPLPPRRPRFELRHLSLTGAQQQAFLHGFATSALWPLCHYFLGRMHYDSEEWRMYEQVNCAFAQAALEEAGEADTIWVQDHSLARAPYFIREQRAAARLLFFWHIPFPSLEVFRTLPWRRPLLEGLLACDLVGFHIPEYAQNFTGAAVNLLGASAEGEWIHYAGRMTRVIARPIGIDYAAIDHEARLPRTEERARHLRQMLGDRRLIIGVERMDYTKGIVERLRGIELLLEQEPRWRGRLSLIQVVMPSQVELEAHRQKKREIDEMVGRVNGRFSDGHWVPVHYRYRSLSLTELLGYYRAGDIALVTPLRDGLNRVAKEYVASRIHCDGAVILSEFAGVTSQLPEAIITNPYSREEMAAALARALQMPAAEQQERMERMRCRVCAENIDWWASQFLPLPAP